MAVLPRRRLLVLFSLCILFLTIAKATNNVAPGSTGDDAVAVEGEGYYAEDIQDLAHQIVLEHYRKDEVDAAVLVIKARRILNDIETADRRQRHKSPTYINTFLYYLQLFLDTIFLANVPTQEEPLNATPRGSSGHMSNDLVEAVGLLRKAATMKNPDAQYLLAEMNFYGNYTHPRNYPESLHWYKELASGSGNRSAQNMVGFMYSTGFGGAVERDQAKALVYHTFAALNGDMRSEMTVAYRHHAGIGTPRNCDDAAFFYKRAADAAMDWYLSGPPGGVHLPRNSFRLADEQGGIYGEGASHASAGPNARRRHGDQGNSMDDILEYLDLLARKGDDPASIQLAKLYYEGPKGMKRDLYKARHLFAKVAKKFWTTGNTPNPKASGVLRETAVKSAGYLGRMYLRGEAVTVDEKKAALWFKRGVAFGDTISQHGLAYMYEHGLGGLKKNVEKSTKLYDEAANADHGPSQVAIARMFQKQGDISAATKWFELAARHGIIDAYYWLAEMANNGQGKERSCSVATVYYKIVAEKAEALHSPLQWAHDAYERGDKGNALIGYMMVAEQGYESGQSNVAWLLDEEKSLLAKYWNYWQRPRTTPTEKELALIYWTRSARQSNVDSYVKMGDYYLAGIGTDMDYSKAAASYQAASEYQASAQALWNLGWMHEKGVGVEKDYHLAKRYYDQALEANKEAYLPVAMSLLQLRVKSFWNDITGGTINAMGNDPEPEKDWSFRDWLQKWFSNDPDGQRAQQAARDAAAEDAAATADNENLPGMDGDLYDADFEEDMVENLVILALFMALGLLFFIRNQRQNQQRNGNQNQQGQVQQQQQQQQQQPQANDQLPMGDNDFMMQMPQPLG